MCFGKEQSCSVCLGQLVGHHHGRLLGMQSARFSPGFPNSVFRWFLTISGEKKIKKKIHLLAGAVLQASKEEGIMLLKGFREVFHFGNVISAGKNQSLSDPAACSCA